MNFNIIFLFKTHIHIGLVWFGTKLLYFISFYVQIIEKAATRVTSSQVDSNQ